MKIHFFPHKFRLRLGYDKMWSIGQRKYSIPTITKYCFDIFGLTIMFIREGIK